MRTKRTKSRGAKFSLLKWNDGYAIAFDEGRILKSASGEEELVYAGKAVVRHIVSKLNKLKTHKLVGDSLVDTPCHLYYVLSNHIHHQLEKHRTAFWREFVYHRIHWDRVYRTSPDPNIKIAQKTAYKELYSFLKSRKLDPVDLPLNYAESLEELKKSHYGMVNTKIVRAILRELMSLPRLGRSVVFYITNIHCELSLAVMLVSGRMEPKDYATAILAAEELFPGTEAISKSSYRSNRNKIVTSVKEVLALSMR